MTPAADIVRPRERLSMWDWNVANVDFSLYPTYRAASPGRYDPGLMPWWRAIVDAIDNPTVKEVIVLAVSQGGKEEHCLCFPARYYAGTNRRLHCLYVGHQEAIAEEVYLDRVIGGMNLAHATRNLIGTSNMRGMVYDIGATRFGCTHGGTGGGLKGKPWDVVFCSEVSSYKSVAIIDEARKRGMTRPFSKLVVWGCPDWRQKRPSDDDPLFVEHDQTPKHEWMMKDPVTGNDFFFQVGNGEADGLHWDRSAKRENGTYDLDLVANTAHYVTPDGTVITEANRWKSVLTGKWKPTNPNAPAWKFGPHIHQLMMPDKWKDKCSFGAVAVRYVESLKRGMESQRAFRYEVEAAKWYGEKQTIEVDSVEQRKGSYRHGQRLITVPAYEYLSRRPSQLILTTDVQKDRFICTVREWFDGGDSALVEFAEAQAFKDIAALRAKHGVKWSFVDLGYSERRNEVLEQCLYGEIKGTIPMFGRDTLKEFHSVNRTYDPFEGTAKQGRTKMVMVTFNPDMGKHILARLMDGTDGHQWLIPADIPAEYIRQVTAEECIDGSWVKRHRENHALDDENMQLVAACVMGVFRQAGIQLDQPMPDTPPKAPKRRQRGVYLPD
jgi:hypothetical protein